MVGVAHGRRALSARESVFDGGVLPPQQPVESVEEGILARHPWLAALVLSAGLTLLILKKAIFGVGRPQFEDLSFPRTGSILRAHLAHAWDYTRSGRTPIFAQWPFVGPVSFLHGSTDWFVKGALAGSVFVAGI